MSKCNKCGSNVGCGCNLINGLCASCNAEMLREKQQQQTNNSELPTNKHKKEQKRVNNRQPGEQSGGEDIMYI